MQKRLIWAVWPGTQNFPHVGTQEAMKTPPIQLDHLHVFGLESGSTQSRRGGGGLPLPPSPFHYTGCGPFVAVVGPFLGLISE